MRESLKKDSIKTISSIPRASLAICASVGLFFSVQFFKGSEFYPIPAFLGFLSAGFFLWSVFSTLFYLIFVKPLNSKGLDYSRQKEKWTFEYSIMALFVMKEFIK